MGEKSADKRRRTVPIWDQKYDWWTDAIHAVLKREGIDQKELAKELQLSESAVSRCIARKTPTYEIVVAISKHLGVACPVIIAETENEARHLDNQKQLYENDVRMRLIAQEAQKGGALSQGLGVVSPGVFEAQGSGKRDARRSGKQRSRVR